MVWMEWERTSFRIAQSSDVAHTKLVRFLSDDSDQMEMDPDGVKRFRELPGPLHNVAFTGGGRTGKSTLASAALGRGDLFPADNTKEPVTFGIHAAAVAHPTTHGSLVLLDCEGTDNAFGPSRRAELVGTLALLTSSSVVSVCWQCIDDSVIERLAKLLAGKELVHFAEDSSDIAPPLLVVVNAVRFTYNSEDLEKILSNTAESARSSNRIAIRQYFGDRQIITVPYKREPAFVSSVEKLSMFIFNCKGQQIVGEPFIRLLETFVGELNAGKLIEPVGQYELTMSKYLRDLADGAYDEYEKSLGSPSDAYQTKISDYSDDLLAFESRAEPCVKIDSIKGTYEKIKAELEQRLKRVFQERLNHNNGIGSRQAVTAIDAAKNEYRKHLDGLAHEYQANEEQHFPSKFLVDVGLQKERLASIAPELYEKQLNAAQKEMQIAFANWQKGNPIKDSPKVDKIVDELLQEYKNSLLSEYTEDEEPFAPNKNPNGDRLRFLHLSQVLVQIGVGSIEEKRSEAFLNWKETNKARGQEITEVLEQLGSHEVDAGDEKVTRVNYSRGQKAMEGAGWGSLVGGTIGACLGGPVGAAAGSAICGALSGGLTRLEAKDEHETFKQAKKRRYVHLKVRRRNGEEDKVWQELRIFF